MSESGNFRSKLFGGFNRQDVSDYITHLAAQRNSLQEKCEKLEAESAALHERADEAERKAEEQKRLTDEYIINVRESATRELNELLEKYEAVRSDMEVTTAHIRCELTRIGDGLSLLTEVLGRAGDRFSELKDFIGNGEGAEENNAE